MRVGGPTRPFVSIFVKPLYCSEVIRTVYSHCGFQVKPGDSLITDRSRQAEDDPLAYAGARGAILCIGGL